MVIKRRLLLLIFLIAGLVGSVAAALWLAFALAFSPCGNRASRIVIAYDQLVNAATGGSEDETISSRAARLRKEGRGWACVLCRILDGLDKDHCNKSAGI